MQAMPRAGDTPQCISLGPQSKLSCSAFWLVFLCVDACMGHASCSQADALCQLLQDNSYKHFPKAERRMENGVASGRSYANFYLVTQYSSMVIMHLLTLLGVTLYQSCYTWVRCSTQLIGMTGVAAGNGMHYNAHNHSKANVAI